MKGRATLVFKKKVIRLFITTSFLSDLFMGSCEELVDSMALLDEEQDAVCE